MRILRLLLILCLCLAVPFSATAALLDGPVCPDESPTVAAFAHDHHHAGDEHADVPAFAKAIHCDADGGDKPCPGSHCACGCGLGLCGVSFHFQAIRLDLVLLVAPSRLSIGERHGLHAEPLAGALLRPPIA